MNKAKNSREANFVCIYHITECEISILVCFFLKRKNGLCNFFSDFVTVVILGIFSLIWRFWQFLLLLMTKVLEVQESAWMRNHFLIFCLFSLSLWFFFSIWGWSLGTCIIIGIGILIFFKPWNSKKKTKKFHARHLSLISTSTKIWQFGLKKPKSTASVAPISAARGRW